MTEAGRPVSDGGQSAGVETEACPEHLMALYRQQARRIYRLCLSYLKNTSDAEDATQEAFIRAAPRLDSLSGDPGAYLTAVARNVSCDYLRHRARANDVTRRGLHHVEHRADAESAVVARSTLRSVWVSLQRHEREMLLDTFAGYSYDEISHRSGLSVPAVASIISRARQRARRVAESLASAFLPAAIVRRVHGRSIRTLAQSCSDQAVGVQASVLVIGSLMSCIVAGALGTVPPSDHDITIVAGAAGQRAQFRLLATEATAAGVAAAGAASRDAGATAGRSGGAAAASAVLPLDIAGEIVAPPAAQQQDTAFSDVVASPHYQQDGTVYASGNVVHGCRRATCPVLFRSTDRGVSWQQVASSGFPGGSLILPAAFPLDPTMFAMSSLGLVRSDDAGRTFVPVVPVSAAAAAVPGTAPGDARILIGSNPPLLYSQRTGLGSAGVLLPVDLTEVDDVAFAGAGHLVVTGMRPDAAGTGFQDAAVVDCNPTCGYVLSTAHDADLHLAVSPQFARDGTYFAFSTQGLYTTRDGGSTMSAKTAPIAGRIAGMAVSPSFALDGRATLSAYTVDGTLRTHPLIAASRDGGRDFPQSSSDGLPATYIVSSMVILPDGRSLATLSGPDAAGMFGIRCSRDDGITWRTSC